METEWIEWAGGECPIKKGEDVVVRYRDGFEQILLDAHVGLLWLHLASDPEADIIAYRIVKE